MTHHSNISIEWILAQAYQVKDRHTGERGSARQAALYWRSKGKTYLPICPTANPDGSCPGHDDDDSVQQARPPLPLAP